MLALGCPTFAAAAPTDPDKLVALINAWRTEPHQCDGRKLPAAGPLAPAAPLARAEIGRDPKGFLDALKRAGYTAAQAQTVSVSGPRSPEAAMAFLEKRYCDVLSSRQFADIGVARNGNTWRLVVARPILSPDLKDWQQAWEDILKLTNAARAESRTCGGKRFGSAPPLKADRRLAQAALAHSRDMATGNYFSHTAKDGSAVADRASREGYRWRRVGENIATGQGSPQQVVSGWLASPEHCANIMEPGYTEMGAAYFIERGSNTVIFWTQVFGTPER